MRFALPKIQTVTANAVQQISKFVADEWEKILIRSTRRKVMSDKRDSAQGISFAHLGGRKIGHPVPSGNPVDLSGAYGKTGRLLRRGITSNAGNEDVTLREQGEGL